MFPCYLMLGRGTEDSPAPSNTNKIVRDLLAVMNCYFRFLNLCVQETVCHQQNRNDIEKYAIWFKYVLNLFHRFQISCSLLIKDCLKFTPFLYFLVDSSHIRLRVEYQITHDIRLMFKLCLESQGKNKA